MGELPQQKVVDIMRFLESRGGEAVDTSVAANVMIKPIQMIGENYPWYYYVNPSDGKSYIRHQSLGPPGEDPPYGAAQGGGGGYGSSPYGDSGKGRGSKVMGILGSASGSGLSQATDEDNMYAEQFLMSHQVEDHAATAFRNCAPEIQRIVINKGSMQGARDQTAVLMDRMGKATQAVTTGVVDNSSVPYAQPGDWTCPNCLDLQFARNAECRKCGTPNPNPNAAALKRGGNVQAINQFKAQHQYEAEMATDEDKAYVEAFLAHSSVDAKASDMLRGLPPDLQKMVINKGSLQDARDQTAVLISRMNLATQTRGITQNSLKTGFATKPGDWVCPGCLDLQFARNATCRKCQTPNPTLQVADPVVDEFLLANEIQDHAAMRFKGLDKGTQEMIMSRGSLEGSRDKTAVLMSRMRQAAEGTLQNRSMEPNPGDWYCPNCNDLQFRRNAQCRKCGTPNPGTGGVQARPSQFGGGPSQFGGGPSGNQFDASAQGNMGNMANMQQMMNMMQQMSNMMKNNNPAMNQNILAQLSQMSR